MKPLGYLSEDVDLDAVFGALADPTRRAILHRLSHGGLSVNELAEPFDMSQPAVSKHLKVLERAGLVHRDVDGQRRPARLQAKPLEAAVSWLEDFRGFWHSSLDELDKILTDIKASVTKGTSS